MLLKILIISLIATQCCALVDLKQSFKEFSENRNKSLGVINFISKVPLDHFEQNTTMIKFWTMVCRVKFDNYKNGGPIFLIVGERYSVDYQSHWLETGIVSDLAATLNGTVITFQHRYYGSENYNNTLVPDLSTKNLQYLTSAQVLGDMVHLTSELNTFFPNSKIIVVGSGYSGTLAAWFRQKYPHLAVGAWVSSGPLLVKFDYYEGLEVIGDEIWNRGGEKCYSRIKKAFEHMQKVIDSGNKTEITNMEKFLPLCSSIDVNNTQDISSFFYTLAISVAASVNIEKGICSVISNNENPNDFEVIADYIKNTTISDCINFSYELVREFIRNTSWDSPSATSGGRQLLYQKCTEFGGFLTSGSPRQRQPFGNKFPIKSFEIGCEEAFYLPNSTFKSKVEWTNVIYGGLKPGITNAFFTTGSLSLNRNLIVSHDLNPLAPAEVILNEYEGTELLSLTVHDSVALKNAKWKAVDLMMKWLK